MKKNIIAIIIAINGISCATAPVLKETAKPASVFEKTTVPDIVDEVKEIKCPDLKIGFVASFTGEYEEYSKNIKNAVELAIKQFNLRYNTNISLEISDTEGKNEEIENFYKIAEQDKKIVAIIGPVFSQSLMAVLKQANEKRIPTITSSALCLEKIPGNSFFFQNVVLPSDEGRIIAEHAVKNLGKKKLAVIYSANNLYSVNCANSFLETVKNLGGEIVKAEKYEEGTFDFKDQMISLGGIDPHIIKDIIESDKQNLESILGKLVNHIKSLVGRGKANKVVVLLFKNIAKENLSLKEDLNFGEIISKKISYGLAKSKDLEVIEMSKVYKFIGEHGFNKEEVCKNFETGIFITGNIIEKSPLTYTANVTVENVADNKTVNLTFDFGVSDMLITNPLELEAVYLPVNYIDAESIISHLLFYDLRLMFLGNSKWYDDKFLSVNKVNLEGSFFSAPFFQRSDLQRVADFVSSYKDNYFEEPDNLSAFGFDTANLLLETIKRGACDKDGVRDKLLNLQDIWGVTGKTSFTNGDLKKELYILGIKKGEVIEVK